MRTLARRFRARASGDNRPADQQGLATNRFAVALTALAVAAYALALVLPNFEACYYGCSTWAGYQYVFGTTLGSALIVVAFALAHVSFWLAATLLLRGVRRRWVAIALAPYGAFCGWLGSLVLAPDVFRMMLGWWLWPAAGILLVTAMLVARRPNVGMPILGATTTGNPSGH